MITGLTKLQVKLICAECQAEGQEFMLCGQWSLSLRSVFLVAQSSAHVQNKMVLMMNNLCQVPLDYCYNHEPLWYHPEQVSWVEFLMVVNLSSSGLTTSAVVVVPLENMPHLGTLNLSHNRLTHLISLGSLCSKKLRHLNLSDNCVRDLGQGTFTALSALEVLDLHGNFITHLSTNSLQGKAKLAQVGTHAG